jgi:hypothetical protein
MFESSNFNLSRQRFNRLNLQKAKTQQSKVDLISAYLFTAQSVYDKGKGQFFCLQGALKVLMADLTYNLVLISTGDDSPLACDIDKVLISLEAMDKSERLITDPEQFKQQFCKVLLKISLD